ncbi:MAG: DoxX family protein [Fibrobacter sp.]|nr:DoxX family protein [Fibrobacter sp.]
MNKSILTEDLGKLILRLLVGSLLLFHGTAKLMNGTDGIGKMLAAKGIPEFIAYGALVGEILAPVLLILGFCTRAASLLIAFTMFMTVHLALGKSAFTLTASGAPGGEVNFFYFFTAFAILFLGPGRFSAYRGKKWFLK